MASSTPPDAVGFAKLMNAARNGDLNAVNILIDWCHPRLCQIIQAGGTSREDAEDITIRTLEKLCHYIPRLCATTEREFLTYAYGVARTSVSDFYRPRYRQERPLEDPEADDFFENTLGETSVGDNAHTAEIYCDQVEKVLDDQIQKAGDGLLQEGIAEKERQSLQRELFHLIQERKSFQLKRLDYDNVEIARTLGTYPMDVTRILNRLYTKIRKIMG